MTAGDGATTDFGEEERLRRSLHLRARRDRAGDHRDDAALCDCVSRLGIRHARRRELREAVAAV